MTSLATPSFGFAAPAPELAPARSGMPFFSPPAQVMVEPGPMLLADLDDGPSLAAHRARFGTVGAASPGSVGPQSVEQLAQWADTVGLAGRGGAGFPFHVKLRAAAAAPVAGGRSSWSISPRANPSVARTPHWLAVSRTGSSTAPP